MGEGRGENVRGGTRGRNHRDGAWCPGPEREQEGQVYISRARCLEGGPREGKTKQKILVNQ